MKVSPKVASEQSPSGMWLAFDVGCIECGEPSAVIGVYASEKEAQKAADEYGHQNNDWGRDEWGGQHYCGVFALPRTSAK